MSKHTPGPWHVIDDLVEEVFVGGVDENANVFCYIVGRVYDGLAKRTQITDEDMCNARLIAAAPELLEACKALVEYIDRGDWSRNSLTDKMIAARAAIAKAEGANNES